MNFESPSDKEIHKYIENIIKEIKTLQFMEGKKSRK